jgi:hypothetical protein
MTQEALKLALEAFHQIFNTTPVYHNDGTCIINDKSVELSNKATAAIKEALAQPEQECPNLPNCNGGCFQCEYFNVETGEMEYPVAQLEQEHDNSATHLAHCYQGEYPVCKYGDENCPATPKVKTQPEQEYESVLIDGVAYTIPSKVAAEILGLHLDLLQLKQEQEQEPVAWRTFDGEGGYDYRSYEDNESYADDWDKRNPNHVGWVDELYTHSQRTWVGLTDDEIDAIYTGVRAVHREIDSDVFARAIEAKLKQKNGYAEEKNT